MDGSMTDSYLELQAYADRMTVYLWVIGTFFAISLIATFLLFFVLKGDDDEQDL